MRKIGPVIFPHNHLSWRRLAMTSCFDPLTWDHVRPVDRRRRYWGHEPRAVDRVLHKGVRLGGDRSWRGGGRQVRLVQRPPLWPTGGTELVRRTEPVLGPVRSRRGPRPLRGSGERRPGDPATAQEVGSPPRDAKALGQPEDRGETERRSEVREAHAGGRMDVTKRASNRLHSGPGWNLLLPLRPPGRTLGRTNPGSLLSNAVHRGR